MNTTLLYQITGAVTLFDHLTASRLTGKEVLDVIDSTITVSNSVFLDSPCTENILDASQ